MVQASFQVENKLEWVRNFQKSFLLAKTTVEIMLGMSFLIFSNVNVSFLEVEFTWNSYIAAKTLPGTKWVELINKEKFAKTALNVESRIFVIYVVVLEALLLSMTIHPF